MGKTDLVEQITYLHNNIEILSVEKGSELLKKFYFDLKAYVGKYRVSLEIPYKRPHERFTPYWNTPYSLPSIDPSFFQVLDFFQDPRNQGFFKKKGCFRAQLKDWVDFAYGKIATK